MSQSQEFVGHRDTMQIGLFPVDEISVWFPNLVQEQPVHGEFREACSAGIKFEPIVNPHLPEVAVHWVHLHKIYGQVKDKIELEKNELKENKK